MRSAPPPNQPWVVTSIRVLKCAAGTRGLAMCATTLMPLAQKRGSSAAPGICPRNSGEKAPQTVETLTPTFSNTVPRSSEIAPPPPSEPSSVGRRHSVRAKRAGLASASIASKAAHNVSRRCSNQARAAPCRAA